ncbi:hypothetical protein B0A65_01365 [Flavobacterium frigidimaris]|uniref:Uncharacterized protein n=1 Tax=Flavobacterium frigidimaris TaxID=262320 RepID=A0ABX4BVE4_FLAFR|nr:hypothetical protein B0A65_01365 [Flavobacterium frigidimaris]
MQNERIYGTSFAGKSSLTFYNNKKGAKSKFFYTKEEEKDLSIWEDCTIASGSCGFFINPNSTNKYK